MLNEKRLHIEPFVDSSYSRTYLTASNNPFLQILSTTDDAAILAERRRKNDLLAQRRLLRTRSVVPPLLTNVQLCPANTALSTENPRRSIPRGDQLSRTMAVVLSEEQINALPLSSDDEDLREDNGEAISVPQTVKSTAVKRSAPQEKISDSRRSKRQKKDEGSPTKPKEAPEKRRQEPVKDDMLDFLSQPSQSRKNKGYGGSSQRSFRAPSFDLDTPQKQIKHKDIQILTSSPIAQSTVQAPAFSPPPASQEDAAAPSLVIHHDDNEDELDPSLNSTTFSHKRRASSSSLSSVDSLPDYQLDAASKRRLMNETSDPSLPLAIPLGHFRCTICGRFSALAGLDLPFLPKQRNARHHISFTNLAKLPISKQQALCRAHRVRDAQTTWARNDYPTITSETWRTFPDRVSKHVSHLTTILDRKTPSYYLKHLDDALSSARGSQKAINTFFNVTALMLIRHGYYGPKSSKLVAQTILINKPLQKVLDKQMKGDKSMRTAGVGRLVDNVLVPEVLMRIVGEDMGVQDEEARKILDESSELGVLLWGDDDEVEDSVD